MTQNNEHKGVIGYLESVVGIKDEDIWEPQHFDAALWSAQALLTLLRAIEEGKYAIVPCEATDEMHVKIDELGEDYPHHAMYGHDFDEVSRAFKAAIKAAPQDEILKEMFTCKESG